MILKRCFFVFFCVQSAYKEWATFKLYHKLFFKNQSFGPGGNNADTASDIEGPDDTATQEPPTRKRPHEDSDSETESGRKPSSKTTRKRGVSQAVMADALLDANEKLAESEDRRALERERFERHLAQERRQYEEERDRRRLEEEDKRERERREYEEKRDAERAQRDLELRQSDREFNARLLAGLFGKKD